MPNSLDYFRLNFEGMVADAGLPANFEWQSEKRQLRAAVWMPFDVLEEGRMRLALDKFIQKLHRADEVKKLTLTGMTDSTEKGITLLIQIDSDLELGEAVKFGTLDELVNQLASSLEYDLKKRRPKRSKDELPDQSKSHQASVNRYPRATAQFNAAIRPELVDRVSAFRVASGMSKREIIEQALELFLEAKEPLQK